MVILKHRRVGTMRVYAASWATSKIVEILSLNVESHPYYGFQPQICCRWRACRSSEMGRIRVHAMYTSRNPLLETVGSYSWKKCGEPKFVVNEDGFEELAATAVVPIHYPPNEVLGELTNKQQIIEKVRLFRLKDHQQCFQRWKHSPSYVAEAWEQFCQTLAVVWV